MPVPPNVKVKYFNGTTDDLSAVYEGIDTWLAKTKPVGYQLNSTVHFHAEDRVWHILVTLVYQESDRGIIRPVMMMPPKRAD